MKEAGPRSWKEEAAARLVRKSCSAASGQDAHPPTPDRPSAHTTTHPQGDSFREQTPSSHLHQGFNLLRYRVLENPVQLILVFLPVSRSGSCRPPNRAARTAGAGTRGGGGFLSNLATQYLHSLPVGTLESVAGGGGDAGAGFPASSSAGGGRAAFTIKGFPHPHGFKENKSPIYIFFLII